MPSQPHRGGFLAVYFVLGAVLGASAVAAVLVLAGVRPAHRAPGWSHWRPTGGGLGAAAAIARHVGREYPLPDGGQLVEVTAEAPAVAAGGAKVSLGYVAIRGAPGRSDRVFAVRRSNSVLYALCGTGASCSVSPGAPAARQPGLVQREILELALYTFRYEPGIDGVIGFMPPRSGSARGVVVYLRRADVAPELGVPLDRSLDPYGPATGTITRHERRLVEAVTGPHLYSSSLARAQEGDAVLILAPLSR